MSLYRFYFRAISIAINPFHFRMAVTCPASRGAWRAMPAQPSIKIKHQTLLQKWPQANSFLCKSWILSFTNSTLTTSTPSAQGSWKLHLALSHVEDAKETTNTDESHAFEFRIFGTLLNRVTKRPSPSLVQSGQRSIFVDGKCFYFKSLELFMVRGCQYDVNAFCVLYVKGLQFLNPNRTSKEENPCHCQCPEHDMRFCLGSVDAQLDWTPSKAWFFMCF